MVDFGYPVGSIQAPGGVEPIVLMNDAVTGGGYATIGTVISADRDKLAQTKTNDKTRFRSVDLEEALAAREQRRKQMAEIKEALLVGFRQKIGLQEVPVLCGANVDAVEVRRTFCTGRREVLTRT